MKKKLMVSVSIALSSLLTMNLWAQDYSGSSFNEVWDVVTNKNFTKVLSKTEQDEFTIYKNGKLPQYPVNMVSLFSRGDSELKRDAVRTVNERFDYYDRLAKKLHPNGVCVSGVWKINKESLDSSDSLASGYFVKGSTGLFIGRISVAMEDTTNSDDRGFGFAGKIFPTMNPDQVVSTGNFFTVDVLLGTDLANVLDAKTTNEPDLGFKLSKITAVGLGLKIASALKTADENPGFRPLSQVASLELNGEMKQPHWMRLSAFKNLKRNKQADFRNEILTAMNENNGLKYKIEVSDSTKDRNASTGWTEIGELDLTKASVSYGCDRRLHFSHPKLH